MRSLPGVEAVRIKSRATGRPAVLEQPPEPDWIGRIRSYIPSFADEVLAFLLIALGLMSLFTLLSPSSGALGSAWSEGLKWAFGMGAFAISTGILAAGGLLLIPRLGVRVRLNWSRITAGELFFVLALAYIHATVRATNGESGQIEAFARASEGRGGGMVGWAVQEALHMPLGDGVTGAVLIGLLAITGIWLAGVRRDHVLAALDWLHDRLIGIAASIDPSSIPSQRPLPSRPTSLLPSGDGHGAIPVDPTVERPGSDNGQAAREVIHREDGQDVVDLPAIPGRPSIVTGEQGYVALGMTRALHPMRIRAGGNLVAEDFEDDEEEEIEVELRFTVGELRDKKRIRKRTDGLPPLELLDVMEFQRPDDRQINLNAQIIERTAEDFGMKVEVVDVKAGPTVTQYAVRPFAEVEKNGQKIVQRVRVIRVANLGQDIALALAAPKVRIQAPVPGTNYIGVEVPNPRPGIVSLRPVIESEQFYHVKSPLALALGREVDGTPFATDLGKMPHLLIGGTTGSGKSVCISAMATCLIANNSPDQLQLVLLDPKMVELVRFNGLPHLLGKVEVQLDRIVGVLRWVTREMERRYKLMEEAMARNIAVFNKGRRKKERLPYIVVMIDELAELMTEYPEETEHLITRLAQMARATGIHLVVATQRPSTDIITGLIKANFPARIAFNVPSGIDSRVIIDAVGAEDLIGRGDMLFQAPDAMAPVRLQGCYVSDAEMERVVRFWESHYQIEYEIAPWERALTRAAVLDETDTMLEEAIRVVAREREASASQLQRRLNVGYPRAGRIVDALEKMGVIGPDPGGGRPRPVLVGPDVDPTSYIVNWRHGTK